MTARKRESIRRIKARLQKARIEWKKENPEAALVKSCADAVEREKRAIDRAGRTGNRADRREAKLRRRDAKVLLRDARRGTAAHDRTVLRQAIIDARRNPTMPNPARVSWLNRLRTRFLHHAAKKGT
jgi:hypothetical protein